MNAPTYGFGSADIVRRTLAVFLPLAIVTGTIFYLLYDLRTGAVSSIRRFQDLQIAKVGSQWIANTIRPIISDVRYLSRQPQLSRFLATGDDKARSALARAHLAFLSSKLDYDQLRFIDRTGMEIMRSDRNDGVTTSIPVAGLQNKSNRYYVQEILKRPPGEIYASPLDLNVENGVLEVPVRPVIRVGMPVHDTSGRLRGLVALNYQGARLLGQIRRLATDYDTDIWLLNADGYWLYGPKERAWAFMYPERRHLTLSRVSPNVWRRVRAATGPTQFVVDGDRFTVMKVTPFSTARKGGPANGASPVTELGAWYLIIRVPAAIIAKESWKTTRVFLLLGILAFILLLLVSIKVAQLWGQRVAADAEIKVLNNRLVTDNIKLEAVNKELEAFNYSVSHDLRAPLRAIDGFSQALEEDNAGSLNEDGRMSLDRIRNAAQRMGELIDDLLNLSRISRSEMTPVPVDLSNIAQTVAQELRQIEPDRNVEVVIAPDLTARGDPGLLRVVLENLLGNAWKFTRQRTPARIEFGQRMVDGLNAFYVKDNGVGFDMAFGAKIFHAFQRLHDRREFPGTGIGLAIVQRVLNKHGGRIWADSKLGEGTTFFFVL